MGHTRIKIYVVALGVGWCCLLVYVMSSLKWKPGEIDGNKKPSLNGPSLRIEKNQVILNGVLNKVDNAGGPVPIEKKKNQLPDHLRLYNATIANRSVKVVISGDASSLMGIMAAMNSIMQNTVQPVYFLLTLPLKTITDLRDWIRRSPLSEIKYVIRPHIAEIPQGKPQYAKIYIDKIFPEIQGIFVYLDNDVIVQGAIQELSELEIPVGYSGLFSEDCNPASKRISYSKPFYSAHVNLKHPKISSSAIKPGACTFNTDVFVANMTVWKKEKIFSQLQQWVNISHSSSIVGMEPTADSAEVAYLLVFYHKIQPLPQMWHIGELGARTGAGYSKQFISSAKLLHWNGHYKPWARRVAFYDAWHKHLPPDPNLKYRPFRRYA